MIRPLLPAVLMVLLPVSVEAVVPRGGGRPAGGGARPAPQPAARPAPRPAQRPMPQPGARPNPQPGARPNTPVARPGLAPVSRPNPRPSQPAINRPMPPSLPGVARPTPRPGGRPDLGNRPTTLPGNLGPGLGGGSGINRPVTRPGNRPPGTGITRPTPGPGLDPGFNRPNIGNRPGGGITGPGIGIDRPNLGGNRPGSGINRPDIGINRPGGGINRPDIGINRPGGGINRPNIGINRPNIGINRPNIGINRPNIGINRPNININNQQNNIINQTNINQTNIVNRPTYVGGFRPTLVTRPPVVYRPWASYYTNWQQSYWSGWSNWPAFWGRWNDPLWLYTRPTNIVFTNPFYVVAPTTTTVVPLGLDYSQPIAVPDKKEVSRYDDQVVQSAMRLLEVARQSFQVKQYARAEAEINQAIALLPGDTTLHEFRALVLFATGRYQETAAVLYSVLANGPGWNWETLSANYTSGDEYAAQLHALETFVKDKPDDAAGHFVLAYHYLALGENPAAAEQFREVLRIKPDDKLSASLFEALIQPPSEKR